MNLLGRFIPGDSFLHKLDPRIKLTGMILWVVTLFFIDGWVSYTLMSLVTISIMFLTKIRLGLFFSGLKAILGLLLFTTFLQVFFTNGTPILWHWGWLTISTSGILFAIFVAIRLVLIVFITTTLTLTTSPSQLGQAIEALLSPLKKVKVPVGDLALILQIAIRFIPSIANSMNQIIDAQRSRGMSFNSGGIIKRIRAIIPIIVPLFVQSISQALDLANAMSARGFVDTQHRTSYRKLQFVQKDYFASGIIVLVIFITIFFNFFS